MNERWKELERVKSRQREKLSGKRFRLLEMLPAVRLDVATPFGFIKQ